MEQLFSFLYTEINYMWVFLLMTIESTVIPFPSEIVVAPAAYKAAQGELNIFLVVLFATLGTNLGAVLNYAGAYYLGRPFVYRFARSKWGKLCMLNEKKIQDAEKYFDKKGAIATLIGRLIPVIRQLISVPAGLSKMNFKKFLLYTTIGGGFWNCVLAVGGYVLGLHMDVQTFQLHLKNYSHLLNYSIIGLVVIGGIYFYIKKKVKLNSSKVLS